MKKKIGFHSSKVWGVLYPLYAREIIFSQTYEEFAEIVQKDFDLTEEQWSALLTNYELFKDQVK